MWQPIETAPKDGVGDILLWDGELLYIGGWDPDLKFWDDGLDSVFSPTHWMKFPDPPYEPYEP